MDLSAVTKGVTLVAACQTKVAEIPFCVVKYTQNPCKIYRM